MRIGAHKFITPPQCRRAYCIVIIFQGGLDTFFQFFRYTNYYMVFMLLCSRDNLLLDFVHRINELDIIFWKILFT